ncbi:hypothetical protein CQW23_17044 [Capsicum baccatum]|uniref:Uncharacterized protein n=1 Tax=Capsicum baccatum TaxID=33114 RepID=A0A2G2WCX1_CAPBA|nr:hypothetical protein CQW23_17044 [Capsicum baccatum]
MSGEHNRNEYRSSRCTSKEVSLTISENLGGIHIYTRSGSTGIQLVGDITRVLLDIALKNLFDSQFPKRFPSIAFYRLINEIYIFIRKNEKVLLDDKTGYALLEELDLRGKIEFIGPGFFQCMPNTRSLGQPLLPLNPELQLIGRMDAQRDIERRATQQDQARLAALAAAQVHQQNIDNPGRATNPDDEDLGDDELLNPRRDAEVATPANRRDRQARFRPERRAMQMPFDDDDDDLDGAGATGAIIPPALAPGAKFNITSTMI